MRRDPYRFISRRAAELGEDVVETRLLLRRATCLTGAEAARVFYDPARFQRASPAPEPLQRTLFGRGGVQGSTVRSTGGARPCSSRSTGLAGSRPYPHPPAERPVRRRRGRRHRPPAVTRGTQAGGALGRARHRVHPGRHAVVREEFEWQGHRFPEERRVLLDLYGTNQDARVWHDPSRFDPERLLGPEPDPFAFVPPGVATPPSTTGARASRSPAASWPSPSTSSPDG